MKLFEKFKLSIFSDFSFWKLNHDIGLEIEKSLFQSNSEIIEYELNVSIE